MMIYYNLKLYVKKNRTQLFNFLDLYSKNLSYMYNIVDLLIIVARLDLERTKNGSILHF